MANVSKDRLTSQTIDKNSTFRAEVLRLELIVSRSFDTFALSSATHTGHDLNFAKHLLDFCNMCFERVVLRIQIV